MGADARKMGLLKKKKGVCTAHGTQQASGSVIGNSMSRAGDLATWAQLEESVPQGRHQVAGMTHDDDVVLTGSTERLTELKNQYDREEFNTRVQKNTRLHKLATTTRRTLRPNKTPTGLAL